MTSADQEQAGSGEVAQAITVDEVMRRYEDHTVTYVRPHHSAPCWGRYRNDETCGCSAEVDMAWLITEIRRLTVELARAREQIEEVKGDRDYLAHHHQQAHAVCSATPAICSHEADLERVTAERNKALGAIATEHSRNDGHEAVVGRVTEHERSIRRCRHPLCAVLIEHQNRAALDATRKATGECEDCEGTGRYMESLSPKRYPCPTCNGTGHKPDAAEGGQG